MTVDPRESVSYAVECFHCGARLRVHEKDLGQERSCPTCKKVVRLPGAEDADRVRKIALAKAEYSFRCKLCGTRMYANPSQAFTTIPCPDCHSPNTVPAVPDRPVKTSPVPDDDEPYRLQGAESDLAPQSSSDLTAAIRIYCSKCDAMMYARGDQVGMYLPCVDCGAAVLVRPQPKSKKTVVVAADPAIDLEPATERVEEPKSLQRFIRSGTAYADRVMAERPIPPKRPFFDGIYTFPFYLEVLPRWVALAMLFMVLVPFMQVAAESQGIEQVLAIPLFIMFSIVFFVQMFAISTMWMTILHITAGGYNRIVDWPRIDIFERIMYVLYPAAATIASTAPFGLLLFWLPWYQSALVQILGFVGFFPVAMLSMLDSGSPAMPYSRLVWTSLRLLPREWCRFHLATVPGWLLIAVWVGIAIYWPNEWVVASIFVGWLIVGTVYFRLLGRLAWVLDQKMPSEPVEENGE